MTRLQTEDEPTGLVDRFERFVIRRRQKRIIEQRREARRARAPQATSVELAGVSEAMAHQRKFRNPFSASRSVFGKFAKTQLDDRWLALLCSIQYTLGAEGKSGGGQLTIEKVNSSWEKLIADKDKRAGHTLKVTLDDPGLPNSEVLVLKDVEFQSLTGGYDLNEVVEQTVFFTFEGWELEEAVDERSRLSEDHPILETWEGAHA